MACVETVGERASAMVAGNHEHGALGLLDLRWFNSWARAAAEWTGEQLDRGHRDFLTGLPLVRTVADATLVHASPRNPEEWDYLVSERGRAAGVRRFRHAALLHRPLAPARGVVGGQRGTGPRRPPRPAAAHADLDDGRRYVVNVGSVGQPRDRDPRARYAIWDLEARAVTIRRGPRTITRRPPRRSSPRDCRGALADRLAHGSLSRARSRRGAAAAGPRPGRGGGTGRARLPEGRLVAAARGCGSCPRSSRRLSGRAAALARRLARGHRVLRRRSCAGSTTPSSTTARFPGR